MSTEGNISYQPTPGLTYDPSDDLYWDEQALQGEIDRTFEICHGCRMCFKYCDTFPDLFSLIDDKYDGEVRPITEKETEAVLDTCFQCKLCEVQCPYTVRDNHEYMLDFPKMVHRQRAQRARKRGIPFADKVLADPDKAGAMARMSLGMANVANKVKLHRWFMEKMLGVHRDKLLPEFAGESFEKWAGKAGKIQASPGGEVVLFQTCYVQNNEPEIGRDTVDVLERNKVDVRCTKGLQCCGMPSWEKGDLDTLRERAKENLDLLEPFVDAGAKVVALNPTCSMMLRREYPELVAPEDKARAEKLAAATMEAGEFLWTLRKEDRFNTDFKSTPGDGVGYHAPCHLRAQGKGFKGRDLMKKIPGVKPKMVMECCGHDGTYAMSVEGFEPSQRIGKKAFDGMKDSKTEVWATDCPLAALQFEQHAGVKPMHPMSVLAKAYRKDGFETPLPDSDTKGPTDEDR
ncbi:MAG: heterodisulfide reductase-related iron-sulfur binding cluster [Planctomycetota bacterium]|jgi:Fe-S oxidoreductase